MTDQGPKGFTSIARAEMRVELYRMEPTADGRGRASRRYGGRVGVVELWIDARAVLELLGPRALRNKSRRAAIADGAVVVKVRGITHDQVDQAAG